MIVRIMELDWGISEPVKNHLYEAQDICKKLLESLSKSGREKLDVLGRVEDVCKCLDKASQPHQNSKIFLGKY